MDAQTLDFQDLSQQVYNVLKNMILVGKLKPGAKLHQDDLAKELGVSRTPLLSAFSKLEKELLVQTVPRKGTFVRTYSTGELVHVYDIRVRLEPLGAEQAAVSASDQQIEDLVTHCRRFKDIVAADPTSPDIKAEDYYFHMRIMHMSGNELLYNIIASYNIITVANFYGFFKDPHASAREHQKIVAAIEERDAEGAAAMMHRHVNNSRIHLISHLNEVSDRIDQAEERP